jgi:hypothetical protein
MMNVGELRERLDEMPDYYPVDVAVDNERWVGAQVPATEVEQLTNVVVIR